MFKYMEFKGAQYSDCTPQITHRRLAGPPLSLPPLLLALAVGRRFKA